MINTLFSFRADLPELGKYTISEDFAMIMIDLIMKNKPRLIVELGSGISTVFAAYCLEQLGQGSILSLDHLELYVNQTKTLLKQHELDKLNVEVRFSPLKKCCVNNQVYNWYETDKLHLSGSVDMLIVDGPPRKTCQYARYPALPIFYPHLSDKAMILLDDASRHDELKIVEFWKNQYPDLSFLQFPTNKGAMLFRKNAI